jgi:hypothetical protein
MRKLLTAKFLQKPQEKYHPSVYEENLDENHELPHFDKAMFSWIAPEYLQHPKSIKWWVGAGIVFVFAVIAEAWTGNWTMLVATIVFGIVYSYVHEIHPPRHTKINISELGVKIGHKNIPFENIESFWIIYNPPHVKRLSLRIKDKLISDLVVELENQDPNAVRAHLVDNVKEIGGVREHMSDIILRLLKL